MKPGPKNKPNSAKAKHRNLSFTDDEWADLARLSEMQGESISGMIRCLKDEWHSKGFTREMYEDYLDLMDLDQDELEDILSGAIEMLKSPDEKSRSILCEVLAFLSVRHNLGL